MATIHPSRMALISQQSGHSGGYSSRRRSPSPGPRRRSRTPSRSPRRERSRSRSRSRERERYSSSSRWHDKGGGDRRRRDDDEGRVDQSGKQPDRRSSPKYDDYSRPARENQQAGHWRAQENTYLNRRSDKDRPHHAGDSYGGGSDYLESRRLMRESIQVNVWPPSPKAPARTLSPKPSKSRKKSKRARSPPTSDSSSEEERRRRERKEKKRSRKERDRERKRHRSRSRSRGRRRSYDYDSETDRREKESRKSTTKSAMRSKSRERSPSRTPESDDEWVVKAPMAPPPVPIHSSLNEADEASAYVSRKGEDVSDDEEVGPQPPPKPNARRVDERAYGSALLRGEGSAMAAFLQEGTEARIPRRGEIGLTSDQIAQFEDVGYVMSGSRHRRMNAVRMRKENQVISAEEKRGILKLQRDERERRETILREEFSELVKERLKSVPGPKVT